MHYTTINRDWNTHIHTLYFPTSIPLPNLIHDQTAAASKNNPSNNTNSYFWYTVRSLINRNGPVTSWLLVGTAWLTGKHCTVFPIQVKYCSIKTTKSIYLNYSSSCRESGSDSCILVYQWPQCTCLHIDRNATAMLTECCGWLIVTTALYLGRSQVQIAS
jgi:hypothetical protein